MPKADSLSAPSRRTLLAGLPPAVAAAGMPAAVTAAPAPDAELIRLCAEYEAAERRIEDLYAPDDVDEDQDEIVLKVINAEITLILDQMEEVRAQTSAGIHARARAVAACNREFAHSFEFEGTWPYRLLSMLLRDTAALEVAA